MPATPSQHLTPETAQYRGLEHFDKTQLHVPGIDLRSNFGYKPQWFRTTMGLTPRKVGGQDQL
jgi:hypothetical protein